MADEIVTIVDKENRVIGSASRRDMRKNCLIHRAAYILVYNSMGELFVQKRTMSKDIYPGYYDIAAGGVVQAGETYEESAQRELTEELGITDTPLNTLFDFFYKDAGNQVWGRVFSCCYDGPLALQVEEVESGAFLGLAEIRRLAEYETFTPDSLYLLGRHI